MNTSNEEQPLQPWELGSETAIVNPRNEANAVALDSNERETLPSGTRVRVVEFQIGQHTDVAAIADGRLFRMLSNNYLEK